MCVIITEYSIGGVCEGFNLMCVIITEYSIVGCL